MEKIYAKLDELGINEEQLPKQLQNIIDGLNERVEELNEEIEELESKGATEEEIEDEVGEEDKELDDLENQIVNTIDSYYRNNMKSSSNSKSYANQPVANNKKSGGGWLLWGGLGLIGLLVGVNVMKK